MAGLMAYEGDIPDSVRRAAQNELDYQRAIKNKLPLAVEGSGISEGTRKAAQNALEGRGRYASVPNTSIESAAKTAAGAVETGGKGLLSRAGGAIFGPWGLGAQAMVTPGELGDGELSAEQREEKNPGETADAGKYAKRVQDNAKKAAGVGSRSGLGLLSYGVDPQEAEAKSVATAEPEVRAVEAQRQGIENNIGKALKDNAVSRPKLAEEVVKADCIQRGIDPTPDEKKKMVAEEVESMRSMDTSQLAKYASFALMGLGFIAGGTSEAAGQAFASSFNNGYQTELKRAIDARNFAAEQAQLKTKNELEAKKVENTTRDIDSKIENREGTLGVSRERLSHDIGYDGKVLAQNDAKIGIQQQNANTAAGGLALRQAEQEALLPLKAENLKARTAASNAAAKKSSEITKKGAQVTSKDAQEFVTAALKAENFKADDKTVPVIAETYRQYQAANPGTNPTLILQQVLKQYGKDGTTSTEEPWFGDTRYGLGEGLLFNE